MPGLGIDLDPAGRAAQVAAALSAAFDVRRSGPDVCREATWLDTADGRLDRAGMAMHDVVLGGRSHIVLEHPPAPALSADRSTVRWPLPLAALPDEAIRQALGPVVDIRALLPVWTVRTVSTELRLLDDEAKTVVRVLVEDSRLTGPNPVPLPLVVSVNPVRGYDKEQRLAQRLVAEACDVVAVISREAMVAAALGGWLQPVRPDLHLDGETPAARSVATVLLALLDVVELNVRGVAADVDTEFLHDLRVAARSTRAIIKLTGDVLPDDLGPRFAAEWKWLTTETALTRDLDVQLLAFDGRDDSIDLTGLHDLGPVHDYLAARRVVAVRGLRRALKSARFRSLLHDWRTALTEVAATATDGPTTAELAAARMRRARRRAIRLSAGVTPESSFDELHDLRKRCKELRYLRESFGSIIADGSHRSEIKQLKAVQDCLGEIQDTAMYVDVLTEFVSSSARHPVPTLLAVGALRDRLLTRSRRAHNALPALLEPVTGTAGGP